MLMMMEKVIGFMKQERYAEFNRPVVYNSE